MTMGHKAKLNATEFDAFTGWKHYYKYLERPGVTKNIKRLFNRRIRRHRNLELEREIIE